MEIYNIKNILKNFYYKPHIPFLKKKFKLLRNKKVLVIGSSPSLVLTKDMLKDSVVVCCNGSASSLQKNDLDIVPYFTVVDNELIDHDIAYEKQSRSKIINDKLLKNVNLGNLISVQSNNSKNINPNILEAKYDSFMLINKNFRRTLINSLLDTNFLENDDDSLVSTGIFSICLSFLFGASEVEFAGFSLWYNEKDYFYSKNDFFEFKNSIRNHSLADSLCIALLKVKKFKVHTKDKDFQPLMTNWTNIS